MMVKASGITLLWLFLAGIQLTAAQSLPYTKLYDDSKVSSIYIYMPPDSVEEMYAILENENHYHATFIFDDGLSRDTVEDIGFRLRGNTSLFSAKKSFKVSFNTYAPGRKYEGVEKLNLLGMHNDPTMVREKLYYDLYNDVGLAGRRSNFVRVYINDEYYGLYTNMEHVDEEYIQSRFSENSGDLYKCTWPADLNWRGDDPNAYLTDGYELHINDVPNDIEAFLHFIDVLNNTEDDAFICALEEVFNVQEFLLTYALDISTGHWDSYGGNINNFYLYHNQLTGKFEFLSFDSDNTFGVDWFGIDWTDRDPYDWPTGWYDVPLVTRLLEHEMYRDQFAYYLRLINNDHLIPEVLEEKVLGWRELIAEAAEEDLYRTYDYGFSYEDFWDAFTTNWIAGHVAYGITPFIEARHTNTNLQIDPVDIAPILSGFSYWPLYPLPGETMSIQVNVWDNGSINTVNAVIEDSDGSTDIYTMYDDGTHNDGAEGDGRYGAVITLPTDLQSMSLTVTATDDGGGTSNAPFCGPIELNFDYEPPGIVINELLPFNTTTHYDEMGDADDYLELYNASGLTVSLYGYYLSDDPMEPWKWQLPDVVFPPDSYLLIWTDNEPNEGEYHTNFRLDTDGETVGLYAPAEYLFATADQTTFPSLPADQSWGRLPNGTGDFVMLPQASPGYNNEQESGPDPVDEPDKPYLTNNPSWVYSDLIFEGNGITRFVVQLFDMEGRSYGTAYAGVPGNGTVRVRIDTERLSSGVYVVSLASSTYAQTFLLTVQ